MPKKKTGNFSRTRFILVLVVAAIFCPGEAVAEAKVNSGYGQEKGPLSSFNDQQLKKLRAGEPVYEYKDTSGEVKNSAGYGQASIIINAPIARCYEIFSNIENQVHYVPGREKAKIAGKIDGKLLLDIESSFYGIPSNYRSIYTIDQNNYRLDFELDKSRPHDIAEMSGFHRFEKIDEKNTLYTYCLTKLDIGVSVPKFLKNYLLGRDLPALTNNVKKYIESNEKWRQ